MKYRALGRSGLNVSVIGFGGWGLGGDSYGEMPEDQALRAVLAAVDAGINFFDTSNLYGNGRSESLLGRALHDRREKVLIATKAGFLPDQSQSFEPASIESSFDSSLARLQTHYVDLFQLHNPPVDVFEKYPRLRTLLDDWQQSGRVRAWGISVRSPEDALQFIARGEGASIQLNFNLVDQRALEAGVFAAAAAKNVGLIARTPLCFGFLTKAFDPTEKFGASDHRKRWSEGQKRAWTSGMDFFLDALPAAAADRLSPAQFALKFCVSYPEISCAIPGMLNLEQVAENSGAGELAPFSAEELARLLKVYQSNSFFDKPKG